MKNNFLRSFWICSLILLNLTVLCVGICRSYENIRRVCYGEYRSAIELSEDGIRILDFEIIPEKNEN